MRFFTAVFAFLFVCGAAHAESTTCAVDAPCKLGEGSYHLLFPDNWDGETPLKALIFFHGHRSTGASVFRSVGLRSEFVENGYLIIAPNGDFLGDSQVRAWPARQMADGARDDVAFTLDVLDDVARRFPIDPDQVSVAGFSAGGSMVWMMACFASERFSGFVSVAGTLRRPNPDGPCPAGPVRLLQIHGFGDGQVPFEGRAIRDWHQGDLAESFSRMRATNLCRSNPDSIDIGERFWCRSWSESCDAGALKMCIHDGGHGLPRGWTGLARDWLEQR